MKTKTVTVTITWALILLAGRAQAQIYDTNNDMVSTFAGYGIPAYVDGQGLLTAFNNPTQIVSDTSSNLYVWTATIKGSERSLPTGRSPLMSVAEVTLTVTEPTFHWVGDKSAPWQLIMPTNCGW